MSEKGLSIIRDDETMKVLADVLQPWSSRLNQEPLSSEVFEHKEKQKDKATGKWVDKLVALYIPVSHIQMKLDEIFLGLWSTKNFESKVVANEASVKVMLSHDYCHFEIALHQSESMTTEDVDNLRKDAQRLADKAIEQYITAKKDVEQRLVSRCDVNRLEKEVQIIKENFLKSEWTPEQKATIKALEDAQYRANCVYDYDDDWEW